jgi:hypothetical protein
MQRRELLKSIAALPAVLTTVITKGATAVEINPNSKYVILADASAIDNPEDFCSNPGMPFPTGTPVIWVRSGAIDDAVRIYEIKE